MFRALKPLNQPIFYLICRSHQAWRSLRLFQPLMMQAIHFEEPRHPDHWGRFCARRKVYRVGSRLPSFVEFLRFVVGQVLYQLAAKGHVQQLHAPADRQHRHITAQGVLQDTQFQVVETPVQFQSSFRVSHLAVKSGINVWSAGEQEAPRIAHQLFGGHVCVIFRHDHSHGRPCGLHHFDV